MLIKGCNIFMDNLDQYVIWMQPSKSAVGKVRVFMKEGFEVFSHKTWFINQDFNTEQEGIDACIAAITKYAGTIRKIGSISQGNLL